MQQGWKSVVLVLALGAGLACSAAKQSGDPFAAGRDAGVERFTDANPVGVDSSASADSAAPVDVIRGPDQPAAEVEPGNDAGGDGTIQDRSDPDLATAPDTAGEVGGTDAAGGADAGAPPTLVEHVVATQVVDRTATVDLADQYAYLDQRVTTLKQLVVYLGYSRSTPSTHKAMLQFVASLGYRVISPQYRNDVSLMNPCYQGTSASADCFYNARLEVFEGVDHSSDIDVKPADSIEVRVTQFLTYLDGKFPSEGWGQYVDAGKPKWADIIVAGHSQGAASTGLITKVRGVFRAVMFAGPDDNNMKTKTDATWPSKTPVTPVTNIYAFVNLRDLNYAYDAANWKSMGLGAAQPVDGQGNPYMNAHLLTSNLTYPSSLGGNGAHLMLAAPATPLGTDGKYVYAPVWRYLFGVSP